MIDLFRRRKRAYAQWVPYEKGQIIGPARTCMADLARFCRIGSAPVVKDANGRTDEFQTGVMVGRQEVLNRIKASALIDESTLFNLKDDEE